jgi:hypothetical protein
MGKLISPKAPTGTAFEWLGKRRLAMSKPTTQRSPSGLEFTSNMPPKAVLEKMGECLRAIQATTDPAKREALIRLQQHWIAVANNHLRSDEGAVAKDIATVSQLHALVMATMHREIIE